jgi:hypothetical protein
MGAWRMARFGNVLLVATRTISGCDAKDTGLWRSTDNGASWDAVPMDVLKISTSGCDLAAIYKFAAAPDAPQAIYAPTTNVGLLKGNLDGTRWEKVSSQALPPDLFSVAVLADEPETVFVSGATHGVYRRRAGEADWTRLDGQPTCAPSGDLQSLPTAVAQKAHLASNGKLVYVAGPQLNFNPPAILPGSGIYMSADGGNCWQQLHDADKRWMYVALATNPNLPDDVFFSAVERDAWNPFNPPHHIVGKLNRASSGLMTLWDEKSMLYGVPLNLFIEPQGKSWYLSNGIGQLIRGSTTETTSELIGSALGFGACRFLYPCFSDVASDAQSEVPLLLADKSVYRWTNVSWLKALFP